MKWQQRVSHSIPEDTGVLNISFFLSNVSPFIKSFVCLCICVLFYFFYFYFYFLFF